MTGSASEKDTALALTHAGVRGTAERAAAGRAGLAVRSPRSDAGTVRLTGRDVAGLVLVGEMPYAPHQSPLGRCDSRGGVRAPRAGGLGCLACPAVEGSADCATGRDAPRAGAGTFSMARCCGRMMRQISPSRCGASRWS